MAEANSDGQVLHVSAFKAVMANTLCILILSSPADLPCEQPHRVNKPSPAEGFMTQIYL